MSFFHRRSLILTIAALAILATTLVTLVGLQRRDRYRDLARYHLGEMATFNNLKRSEGDLADQYEGKTPKGPILAFLNPGNPTQLRVSEDLNAQRSAYHLALSLKYQQAAERPWIAVEPDQTAP